MKSKSLFLLVFALSCALMLSSCAITFENLYTTSYADISLLASDGSLVKCYPNAIVNVESGNSDVPSVPVMSGGGISFYDETGEKHYITGGIIMVDNLRSERKVFNDVSSGTDDDTEYGETKLVHEFDRLVLQVKANNEALSSSEISTAERSIKLEQNEEIMKRLKAIKEKLAKVYRVRKILPTAILPKDTSTVLSSGDE